MGDKSKILRTGPASMLNPYGTLFHNTAENIAFLIRQMVFTNISESPQTFSVYLNSTDPGTSDPTAPQALISARVLQNGETAIYYFSPGLRIDNTEYLIGNAGDPDVVTYTIMYEGILLDLV